MRKKVKSISFNVTLNFSGDGINDVNILQQNVLSSLIHTIETAGLVSDNETEFTEEISVKSLTHTISRKLK